MNKIILAIGLVLGMAQFSHAGEKTIAWDKVDQVREQQVVSEVKRQIKNENSEIAKAIEDADSQNHGIENVKVIEIGSLDINGTIRQHFANCEYVGVDVGQGPNVDLVCEGQSVDHPDNTYDVSGSCNCFEHNPHWVETFRNMWRMTKVGGLVFVSVPTTGCPEHGTHENKPGDSPLTIDIGWNYYKNLTEADYRENFNLEDMFSEYQFSEFHQENGADVTHDIYFYGFKK